MDKITGGCLCGKIRYEASTEPKMMGICYCRSCQQFTGSNSFPFLVVTKDAFSVTGEYKTFTLPGASGQDVNRSFCPDCGCPVFGEPVVVGPIRTICASSLDEPSLFKPQVNIWAEEAPAWCIINHELPTFTQNPPPKA